MYKLEYKNTRKVKVRLQKQQQSRRKNIECDNRKKK